MHLQKEQVPGAANPKLEVGYHLLPSIHDSGGPKRMRGADLTKWHHQKTPLLTWKN